nr:uncharacterized protein LOC109178464 [Ipomoea batatas]
MRNQGNRDGDKDYALISSTVLPVLTPSIPVVSPSSSDDISTSSRSVPAVPESDHTPSSSPAPNLSRTTSSPTVSESSSAEQPAASVLVPSVSPATAPDLPAASGRPARIRKPNSRYYGDQFVNITTVHPMPLALEPLMGDHSALDRFRLQYIRDICTGNINPHRTSNVARAIQFLTSLGDTRMK